MAGLEVGASRLRELLLTLGIMEQFGSGEVWLVTRRARRLFHGVRGALWTVAASSAATWTSGLSWCWGSLVAGSGASAHASAWQRSAGVGGQRQA